MKTFSSYFSLRCIFGTAALFGHLAPASAAPAANFDKDIRPVLELKCVRCHGQGKDQGEFRLHTREDLIKGGEIGAGIVPGDAKKSELIYRIGLPGHEEDAMPQKDEPLTAAEVQAFAAWVDAGAEWPEGVRLKPVKKKKEIAAGIFPESAPKSSTEVAGHIDRILQIETDKKFSKAQSAPGIEDLPFLRRVTVDLIGRIPTDSEMRQFEAWPAAERRAKQVDYLLGHNRFNDRWTVFLADMMRVRSNLPGGRELLAHLNRSIAEGTPYDRLAHQMISANGRIKDNPAVGYILGDEANAMELTAATSQVFLGVRIGCAECHDHPFDDWSQREFYEMAAFFGKTKRMENNFSNTVYTTEQDKNVVLWPPERLAPPKREGVNPKFPFQLTEFAQTPEYISRFENLRAAEAKKNDPGAPSIDDLLDAPTAGPDLDSLLDGPAGGGLGDDLAMSDIAAEAKMAAEKLNVKGDLYRPSELRKQLATMVTDPRNPYFARAFVNRVWSELNGRGFVMPLDNFSDYEEITHPLALEYIAREFIASGYDMRSLVRHIVLTNTYSRGHLAPGLAEPEMQLATKAFSASPTRRMLAEALFDSTVVAGHLTEQKWPAGVNVRIVEKQIRVPLGPVNETNSAPAPSEDETNMAAMSGSSMTGAMADGSSMATKGYSLEDSLELDFDKVLKDDNKEDELAMMRKMSDAQIAAAEKARMDAERRRRVPMRYALKTVEEEIDDNPKFSSTLRMASPAAPSHFVRIFGQPSRAGLGEFRDQQPSLRQQLMMLNGKATNEAARVGLLEPMNAFFDKTTPDLEGAIELAYREALTRRPSADELADAKAVLTAAASPKEGMSDLRWALLNCHEFRYLP